MKKMSYWKKAKIMADVQEKEAVKIHILYLHINPESVYYIYDKDKTIHFWKSISFSSTLPLVCKS